MKIKDREDWAGRRWTTKFFCRDWRESSSVCRLFAKVVQTVGVLRANKSRHTLDCPPTKARHFLDPFTGRLAFGAQFSQLLSWEICWTFCVNCFVLPLRKFSSQALEMASWYSNYMNGNIGEPKGKSPTHNFDRSTRISLFILGFARWPGPFRDTTRHRSENNELPMNSLG